jgi:DNA-binding beta-propeller fold protein YncE
MLKKIAFLLIIASAACNTDPELQKWPASGVAFVVTTDYSTGSYSLISLTDLTPSIDDARKGLIGSDAGVKFSGGKIYINNRFGRDNIQVLDPSNSYVTIREMSTGTSSNPQDIIITSPDRAYVTRYETSELWIINPENESVIKTINLSGYDSDGIPEMSRMYYDAGTGKLFISIQKLDTLDVWRSPKNDSAVIMVNAADNTVEKVIPLQWNSVSGTIYPLNPYSQLKFAHQTVWQPATPDGHDHLFVACVGGWGFSSNTGIVAVDIQDGHCEQGFVIQNDSTHGEIMDFVIKSGTSGYAVTTNASDNMDRIISFNPQTGAITGELKQGDSYTLTAIALDSSGRLFVCDRTTLNPGVRVYDTNNGDASLNAGEPINVGLPPNEIVFIE